MFPEQQMQNIYGPCFSESRNSKQKCLIWAAVANYCEKASVVYRFDPLFNFQSNNVNMSFSSLIVIKGVMPQVNLLFLFNETNKPYFAIVCCCFGLFFATGKIILNLSERSPSLSLDP